MDILTKKMNTYHHDSVVVLGNFDGMHLAHKRLFEIAKEQAIIHQLKIVAVTFMNHTRKLSNLFQGLLITNDDKLKMLEAVDAGYVYLCEFDDYFANMMPQDFVVDYLIKELNTKIVIVGYDFRFGKNRCADKDTLIELGKQYGFSVIVAPAVLVDGKIASSSLIRNYLVSGEVEKANDILGYPFFYAGIIIHGTQKGTNITSFKTINIIPSDELIKIKAGIYVVTVEVANTVLKGVCNAGYAPTLKTEGQFIVETNLFDFDSDLYGEQARVNFHKMLRVEKKFDSALELKTQIQKDVATARRFFGG